MVDDNDIDHDPALEPDTDDPTLSDFIAQAEGQAEVAMYKRVSERLEVVREFQDRLAAVATELWVADKTMLHIEALIAISGIFCGFADHLLASSELEMFEANREQVLTAVGIMSGHVNSQKPIRPDQLANAAISETVN
jgi:hypothetical protein